jgi:hypothetical protein
MNEDNEPQGTDAKASRHRSPNYPAVSLPDAIERVGRLYAADKKAGAPLEAALKHMGFSGKHGKSMMVVSALRKFGLVEDTGGRVVPTQRAVEILVLPKDDPRRLNALREAALSPEVHRELFEQYSQTGFPSDETLQSELIAFKGFNPNAVSDFVRDLRATLEFASLTDEAELDSAIEEEAEIQVALVPPMVQQHEAGTLSPRLAATAVPIKSYSWGLSAETNAELKIIGELSPDDLELLRDYVEITIRALGRNMKKSEPEVMKAL